MRCFNKLYALGLVLLFDGLAGSPSSARLPESRQPSDRPVLRMEAGMHTAMITRTAVDASSRWLVTGSLDKTVRVWDLTTSTLVRVLRPPIGDGAEGKIYAVALSPSGRLVACGGYTGHSWDQSRCIYLFDRDSGQLVRRIAGLPRAAEHLAFSPNGRFLAAALGGAAGLRVFYVDDGTLVGGERAYGGDCSCVDFDKSGRIVTTCDDGYLRLYGSDFRLLSRQKALGGMRPRGVRFSPDGERIAVAYFDVPRVDVLSASDLSLAYSPDTVGVNGVLLALCWSSDGERLYAGGTAHTPNGDHVVRCWLQSGRGAAVDLTTGAENSITDLQPLRTGSVAFASADPCWGLLDRTGGRSHLQASPVADYRGAGEGFELSSDARIVRFSYAQLGRAPARFDLDRMLLQLEGPSGSPGNPNPPRLQSPGLDISDWRFNTLPKCNGRPLALDDSERSCSLAIAPDGSRFLLGADWSLRCFDSAGKVLWSRLDGGGVWAVNISENARLAVAAYMDGTIRWHRMSDGEVLLTLFPHADRRRWILWSPSGYYACSAGAEDLLGWHCNNGKATAADFVSVSRFRATLYRPDLLARVLTTLNEAQAVKLANAEAHRTMRGTYLGRNLPPIVRILSSSCGPTSAGRIATITFTLRCSSGDTVTGVRALVDGRPAPFARRLGLLLSADRGAGRRTVRVVVPERDCTVSLLASSSRTGAGVPATVRVGAAGTARRARPKPNLYLLAVGVGKYRDPDLSPDLAVSDARDVAAFFRAQERALYGKVTVRLLTDVGACSGDIVDGLYWLLQSATPRDVAVFFFAGHADTDPARGVSLMPYDYLGRAARSRGISEIKLARAMKRIAGRAVVLLDIGPTRRPSGGGEAASASPALARLVNELASPEDGTVVFCASMGGETPSVDPAWANSAFTKALLEGLSGAADVSRTGRVTVGMLDHYVSTRVPELTGGTQHPTMTRPSIVPEFPIASVPE